RHTVDVGRQTGLHGRGGVVHVRLGLEAVGAGIELLAAGVGAIPGEIHQATGLLPQVQTIHLTAGVVVDVDPDVRTGRGQIERTLEVRTGIHLDLVGIDDHLAAHQGGRLQRLGRLTAGEDRADAGIEVGDALDGTELRQLRDEFAVALGLQRILVVHLGDHQLEELVLAELTGLLGLATAAVTRGTRLVDGVLVEHRLSGGIGRAYGHGAGSLLTEGQYLLHHLFGGIHHFRIGLEGATGRNHVGHLFHHVHVGVVDIAVLVRHRVVGLIALLHLALVLDDALDLHPNPGLALVVEQRGAALGLVELGGEHRCRAL
ncbi:hypothetical protein COLO4_02497, partial [Corchorus olitorius]